MTLLVISTVLLWILVMFMVVLVILLYRQFGLLYLGSGARVRLQGVQVGGNAPEPLRAVDSRGEEFSLDWTAPGPDRATLLLLTAPECPLAEALVPELNEFSESWATAVDVLLVDRALPDGAPLRRLPVEPTWRYAFSPGSVVHRAFDIDVSPYAYVIGSDGTVRARDIVNDTRALAALITGAGSGPETLNGMETPVALSRRR
jgi:methylamine dehydrogenase accessory protein MauD